MSQPMARWTVRRIGSWARAAASSLLLVATLAGCGGGSKGSGRGGAGGAGLLGGVGGAGAGANAGACAALQPADPSLLGAALGMVEARLIAAGRKDASFAALFGADTPAVLAAADALQAQAVEVVAADRAIPLPAAPPGDLPAPASCGVTVSALSVGVGQAWESASFLAAGNLLLAIDGAKADASYPPLDSQVTTPGGTTQMHQTTEISLGLVGSHATATVTLTKRITFTDPRGKALGDTFETATAAIDVDYCPDPTGVSAGTITFTGNGIVTPVGGAAPFTYEVTSTGAYQIHVSDSADTAAVNLDTTLTYRANGPTPVDLAGTFSGTYSDASNAGGSLVATEQLQRADGPADDVAAVQQAIYAVTLLAAQVAEGGAKKKWRGGKCVEVHVAPPSQMVEPGSKLTVSVTTRHKIEMSDLKVPVVATFTGVQSLDPVGKAVPTPAMFQFLAGSTPGGAGVVSLKSTSNRGIGTADATYTVKCDSTVTCSDGQPVDPETCTCPCQIDPVTLYPVGQDCGWKGTVELTASETGQQDLPLGEATEHQTWSLDYHAALSVVGRMGNFPLLSGPTSGSWRTSDVLAFPSCKVTSTVDDAGSGNLNATLVFDAISGGIISFQGLVGTPVTLSGTASTGAVGSMGNLECMIDFPSFTSPDTFQLFQGFSGSGSGAGSTFRGTSVAEGPPLPDGTSAKLNVSWNLKLVRQSPATTP